MILFLVRLWHAVMCVCFKRSEIRRKQPFHVWLIDSISNVSFITSPVMTNDLQSAYGTQKISLENNLKWPNCTFTYTLYIICSFTAIQHSTFFSCDNQITIVINNISSLLFQLWKHSPVWLCVQWTSWQDTNLSRAICVCVQVGYLVLKELILYIKINHTVSEYYMGCMLLQYLDLPKHVLGFIISCSLLQDRLSQANRRLSVSRHTERRWGCFCQGAFYCALPGT